jgi:hypothetical protein
MAERRALPNLLRVVRRCFVGGRHRADAQASVVARPQHLCGRVYSAPKGGALLEWLRIGCLMLALGLFAAGAEGAQPNTELEALNQRIIELFRAGSYDDAIPLAERYSERG